MVVGINTWFWQRGGVCTGYTWEKSPGAALCQTTCSATSKGVTKGHIWACHGGACKNIFKVFKHQKEAEEGTLAVGIFSL